MAQSHSMAQLMHHGGFYICIVGVTVHKRSEHEPRIPDAPGRVIRVFGGFQLDAVRGGGNAVAQMQSGFAFIAIIFDPIGSASCGHVHRGIIGLSLIHISTESSKRPQAYIWMGN